MKVELSLIFRILSIVFGGGLFLWFVLPVFITFQINIGVVTGACIGILLLIYGIWQKEMHHLIISGWHCIVGKIVEIILLAICAIILILAVACSIAMISASSSCAEANSTVLVLGARVYKDHVSTSLKYRLDAAYEYLENNPESVCILSGGQGKNESCTESSLMYAYLLEKGISSERLYIEDQSTDTEENIAFSKQIIEDNNLNPVIAMVTSDYHEYRALKYAQRAGLTAAAVPASTQWWIFPTSVVREMYGILEQWFLNR